MDIGSVGLEDSLKIGVTEMIAALKTKSYEEGKDLFMYNALNAEHSEKYWAERIWRPLIFMFGNKESKKLLYRQ